MKRKWSRDEVQEWYRAHGWGNRLFYFNKEDANMAVPKPYPSMGWTLNFADPRSYVLLGGILSAVFLIIAIFS